MLIRFRVPYGADGGSVSVFAIADLLRLAPRGISYGFGTGPRGERRISLDGADPGEVAAFAARLEDAIGLVGDVLRGDVPEAAAADAPATDGRGGIWSYEPPDGEGGGDAAGG